MEVEAKFSLPDQKTLDRLRVTTRLAGFPLLKGRMVLVQDTYVDTSDRKILAGGYACRFRRETEGVRLTLKRLGGASHAIHRREEAEILLPAVLPLEEWPTGSLKRQALRLTGGDQLLPLIEIHQQRMIRPVRWQGQVIAELSLDEVSVTLGGIKQAYTELEVELTSLGSEEQLGIIVGGLQQKWGLQPEPLSKFERALKFLDTGTKASLSETLERIARRDDLHGLRSRALMALSAGVPLVEVCDQVKRSRRTIRRWWASFQRLGLEIFPVELQEAPPFPASPAPDGVSGGETIAGGIALLQPHVQQIRLPKKPGVKADDLMVEVVRKIMSFQFQHMLYHEPGTLLGQDIEALHDMRVATRRMRAALRIFGDYLDEKAWDPFEKGLRRTGRALGAVRDLDVFWEKTQAYLDTLPTERKDELAPLRFAWQTARDLAREKMISYLRNDRYRQFKESLGKFLKTHEPGAAPAFKKGGEPMPRRLRHVAPIILLQGLATMRAFDEWTIGPDVPLTRLHQLRIASKGLRYTLEFLQEVLGKETKPLIDEIKTLQDHLGSLQDALVASTLLRDFLTWGSWGHGPAKRSPSITTVIAPGVALYLATRQAELQALSASFPQVWARIQESGFKRNLIHLMDVL